MPPIGVQPLLAYMGNPPISCCAGATPWSSASSCDDVSTPRCFTLRPFLYLCSRAHTDTCSRPSYNPGTLHNLCSCVRTSPHEHTLPLDWLEPTLAALALDHPRPWREPLTRNLNALLLALRWHFAGPKMMLCPTSALAHRLMHLHLHATTRIRTHRATPKHSGLSQRSPLLPTTIFDDGKFLCTLVRCAHPSGIWSHPT
ncbi:hypothetical protein PENSPDRAFT_115206 [Peniophora sp. CONT]|nr:hypothetical protein PENSPDRAFT_115206 [Peniophora sp. CONT]